jgi:hypothetical protein
LVVVLLVVRHWSTLAAALSCSWGTYWLTKVSRVEVRWWCGVVWCGGSQNGCNAVRGLSPRSYPEADSNFMIDDRSRAAAYLPLLATLLYHSRLYCNTNPSVWPRKKRNRCYIHGLSRSGDRLRLMCVVHPMTSWFGYLRLCTG